jgi:hypothetical protein
VYPRLLEALAALQKGEADITITNATQEGVTVGVSQGSSSECVLGARFKQTACLPESRNRTTRLAGREDRCGEKLIDVRQRHVE